MPAVLAKFAASTKWTFLIVVLIVAGVLVALGKLTKDDFLKLVEWLGGATAIARGIEGRGQGAPLDGTLDPASAPPAAPSAKP